MANLKELGNFIKQFGYKVDSKESTSNGYRIWFENGNWDEMLKNIKSIGGTYSNTDIGFGKEPKIYGDNYEITWYSPGKKGASIYLHYTPKPKNNNNRKLGIDESKKIEAVKSLLEKYTGKKVVLKEAKLDMSSNIITQTLKALNQFDTKTERAVIGKLLKALQDRKYDLTFSLGQGDAIPFKNIKVGTTVNAKAMNSNEWEPITVLNKTKKGIIGKRGTYFVYAQIDNFKDKEYLEIKTTSYDLKTLDYKSYE